VVVLDVTRNRAAGPRDDDGPDAAPVAGDPGPEDGPDRDDDAVEEVVGEVVMVDQPDPRQLPSMLERAMGAERRPVVPVWVADRDQLTATTRWAAGYVAHTAQYHAARLPLYLGRLVGRAPWGAARLAVEGWRWVLDVESRPVRSAAVRREDAGDYLKLVRQRDAHVRWRGIVAAAAGASAVALAVLAADAPSTVQAAVAVAVVALLGMVGSAKDRPLIDRAVVAQHVTKLTSDVVERALGSLGLAGINSAIAKGAGITFPAPITRDGPGWRADVDLPYGVTATDVLERRDKLASGLRRPLGCVWPEPAHDLHAGRLVLWVGDQDMSQAKPAPWPLTKKGSADLFRPVPFGADQRGRPISITLMEGNVLIGAMPGVGKTFALRVLLLACALDVRAELRVFELKGSGDLSVFERIAHRYASGPDDEAIEATMASLREVYRELERRAKTIRDLPREQAPENKVTPELAGRKSLGLHPLVVAVDECQELFSHSEHGKEAGELATAIIKRGRALGVILLLATQRPDKDSLPTGVSANVGIRFCLRVMGQIENDMILGTSAYKNGIRATTFTKRDKGIGYLLGAADDPAVVRSAYLDGPAAERVCDRARTLREAAGRLTGHALGEVTATPAAGASLLADILAVVPAGEHKVWSEVVVERLAELRPEVYDGWGAEQLAAALKPHGVDTVQIGRRIDGRTVNRRGVDRADIARVHTQRDRNREVG